MTEVFIAALSTTRLQMNDQDLEFYRDEKAKEIQEVRVAFQQLHQFALMNKKERQLANHSQIWRSLLILSKIIGFQTQFALIDQLRIPQSILTQQLWILTDIFIQKHYYPRSTIGCWQTTAEKYYILMEGIVQKELVRTSIIKFENTQNLQLSGCRMMNGSKFKKQNRKRFARTDQQIPICLNSKRSEGRNIENAPGYFRSLTDVEMFEVSAACWKSYVSNFKRLQEEYLMNFIRKKINISLNFDQQDKPKTNRKDEQSLQETLYSIVTLERKSIVEFNSNEILLLYMGEMLVTTNNYKIQTSRGCVLNPAIHQSFTSRKLCINDVGGNAIAKNLCTVIKIYIHKLQLYFHNHSQERNTLIQLLIELQSNRKIKNQQEKMLFSNQMSETQSIRCRPSKMIHKLACESNREVVFNKIWQSSSINKGKRSKDKIIGLKSIQNLVEKTAKAAELKHIQYLKKAHLSQDVHNKTGEQNTIIPFSIFKDCMRNIQNKNENLKQALRVQRQKYKNQLQGGRRLLNDYRYESLPSKAKMIPLTDSSIYLRKKIKDIYVKTEGSQEIINFATSSQRPTAVIASNIPTRQTVGPSMLPQQYSAKDFDNMFVNFGRGVMKKVQTGKIRRINIK